MTTHDLKQDIQFWDKMQAGLKPFEIRKNDRPYKVGDTICLYAVGKCCNYCDGISYKYYYNGVCKGWQNAYKHEASTYCSLITEIISPEDYNNSDRDTEIDNILQSFFNSKDLMEDYVILRTVALPKL